MAYALTMEAIACREGVAYAGSRGIQNLQVETDSQEVVKPWEMGELQRSRVSPIIREIIRELCTVFHAFSLVYANRSCNPHTLAKQVSEGNRVDGWHSIPFCIANLLAENACCSMIYE
jgi:hypothetical protein